MKKTALLLAFIAALFSYSCEEFEEYPPATPSSELIFKAAVLGIASDIQPDSVVFTGDDLLWFDATTKEFRLIDEAKFESLKGKDLLIYRNEEYLFSVRGVSSLNSQIFSEPVFYYNIMESAFYLQDGYPEVSVLDYPDLHQLIRNEKMAEIEDEWTQFMDQLKKEGKYKE